MRIRFIVNPHSGHNRRRPRLADDLRRFATMASLDADVVITEAPGHATELARDGAQGGCSLVVAVGGDGTMNEVARALTDTPVVLALVPCGSGNGLARHLGIPRGITSALELVRQGRRHRSIDTATVNARPFFNAMGFGFDADVSRRFNRLVRRGLPAYVRVGFTAFCRRRAERCDIVADNERLTTSALLVAIANSEQYGNNARIAPGARVDDGLLDLVLIKPVRAAQLALLVPRLFLGTIDRSPHVRRLRASMFAVKREVPGIFHTDGETHAPTAAVSIEVKPRSLRVLVPEGTAATADRRRIAKPFF